MQIKRHWFLVETMPFEYFFSGVNTPASCSNNAAQATPKGLLRLARAPVMHAWMSVREMCIKYTVLQDFEQIAVGR